MKKKSVLGKMFEKVKKFWIDVWTDWEEDPPAKSVIMPGRVLKKKGKSQLSKPRVIKTKFGK